MYEITGQIEGVADILFHRFTEEAKDKLDNNVTGGTRTPEQAQTEAGTFVYRDDRGLVLPADNLNRALVQGCQKASLKEGKKGLASLVEATVFVQGAMPFGVTEPDYIHECSGRRPPRTGGRCVIRRSAMRAGWKLPFKLAVTDDRRNPDSLRLGLEHAGLLVGLGDWRPKFGRFIVTVWQVKGKASKSRPA